MTVISAPVLADAELAVRGMDMALRERLVDEIFARQPNLLGSVLVQRRFGATLEQVEVLVHVMLVCYQAMTTSATQWPVITEDVQERCLARLVGRVRFIEGLSPEQQTEAVTAQLADHAEPWLLAFVFGELKQHGVFSLQTETQKYLVLAALNMVECIAEVARTSGH